MENNETNELEIIVNPFEVGTDNHRYWDYFNSTHDVDLIQRLYNVNKITKDDFTTITNKEPKGKESPKGIMIDTVKDVKVVSQVTLDHDIALMEKDIEIVELQAVNSDSDITLLEMQIMIFDLQFRIKELERINNG